MLLPTFLFVASRTAVDMAGAWLPSASRLQFFSSRCTLAACAAFAIKRKKKVPNVQWLQDRADLRMELEEQIVSTVQPSLAIPTIHTYRMKTPVHSSASEAQFHSFHQRFRSLINLSSFAHQGSPPAGFPHNKNCRSRSFVQP